MRVRMKADQNFCPDGIHLQRVKAGDSVIVPDHIAKVWLEDGRAEEDKMVDGAPQMKAEGIRFEHVGPKNATLEVFQGTSPYEVPPPGVVPKKPKLAKKVK